MIVVGIDPGLSGGLSIIDTDPMRIIRTTPLKVFYKTSGGAKLVDGVALEDAVSSADLVVLEKQVTTHHDGRKSLQTTMMSYGVLLDVTRRHPHVLLDPRVWTAHTNGFEMIDCGENWDNYPNNLQNKFGTISFVYETFGTFDNIPRLRNGRLHDGITDASAIAYFGWSKFTKEMNYD